MEKTKNIIVIKPGDPFRDKKNEGYMVYRAEQPSIRSYGKTKEAAINQFFKSHMIINIIDLTEEEKLSND